MIQEDNIKRRVLNLPLAEVSLSHHEIKVQQKNRLLLQRLRKQQSGHFGISPAYRDSKSDWSSLNSK